MPPRESEPVVSISPSSPPPEFRSHRRLGEQLDLFHFPAHSLGMACWHPAGLLILRELERYIRELLDRSGYMEVRAPLVCDAALWERSGHLAQVRRQDVPSRGRRPGGRASPDELPRPLRPVRPPAAQLSRASAAHRRAG